MELEELELRDYFAAKSLPKSIDYRPGGFRNWIKYIFGYNYKAPTVCPKETAKKCYEIADAMLNERIK